MKNYTIGILYLLTCPLFLLAQGEDQFLPTELKQLTAVTEPATLRKGFFKLGLDASYISVKRYYDDQGEKTLFPGAMLGRASYAGIHASYGITDRFQVNSSIPYMLDLAQSVALYYDPLASQYYQGLNEENGSGIGDISVGLYGQVLQEKEHIPSITARATLMIPTGRKEPANIQEDDLNIFFDGATGSGEFSLAVDLQFRKIIYPYSFSIYSGFDYGFGGYKSAWPGEEQKSFKSGTVFYAAAGLNFHLNEWICMTNDFYYNVIGKAENDGSLSDVIKWNFNWVPYIHFQIKQLRLAQGFMIPLTGRNVAADPSYILIVQYIF